MAGDLPIEPVAEDSANPEHRAGPQGRAPGIADIAMVGGAVSIEEKDGLQGRLAARGGLRFQGVAGLRLLRRDRLSSRDQLQLRRL
jgi:hypothetical protein